MVYEDIIINGSENIKMKIKKWLTLIKKRDNIVNVADETVDKIWHGSSKYLGQKYENIDFVTGRECFRKIEKVLDKEDTMRYDIKVASENDSRAAEKYLKKVLDKEWKRW